MSSEFDTLVRAALDGDEETLKALVARGGDINQYNELGQTPLLTVVFIGDAVAVDRLLRHGADPNRSNRNDPGSTPLWHATDDFGLDDVAEVLVRFGARA